MRRIFLVDGEDFIETNRLGSGLLAVVYAAENKNNERVAVKIPAPNLPLDQLRRFDEEYDLLAKLAASMGDPCPVPKVRWGYDSETNAKVLILELAPDNKLLDEMGKVTGWQRELVAMRAAVQYTQVLQALHSLPRSNDEIGYTCVDRKIGDLRWDEENNRLVVLDWNAVRPLQEKGVLGDISTFGSLWYQLITGRYVGADLQLLDGADWADDTVSIGTREILLRSLALNNKVGFDNVTDLATAVNIWVKYLEQDPEELFGAGSLALSSAEEANRIAQTRLNTIRQRSYLTGEEVPELTLTHENEALRLLDLAKRKDWSEAIGDFDKALNLVKSQGDRLITTAIVTFEVTRYEVADLAIDWANRTLTAAEQLNIYNPQLKLRVKRWQLLLHIGYETIDKTDLSLRDQRKDLVDAIRQMEEAEQSKHQINEWQLAQNEIKNVIRRMGIDYNDHPITLLLNHYITETNCRIFAVEAEENIARGEYLAAAQSLEEAANLLKVEEEDEIAQAYINSLQAQEMFFDLDGRITHLHYKARTADISKRVIKDISLGKLNAPATYIVQRLEEAQYFFADDPETWQEIENQSKLDAILWLAQCDYHQASGQWAESLIDIENLLRKYSTDDQVRENLIPYIHNAFDYVNEAKKVQASDLETLDFLKKLQNLRNMWNGKQETAVTTENKQTSAYSSELNY